MATYTALDGAFRIYESTATPFYVPVLFDEGDLSFPEGPARPEETPILHRGRHSANSHYILGPDTPILEPLDVSFSFRMQNDVTAHDLLRDALCNPDNNSPWTVGGDTWVTTKGDGLLVPGTGVAGVADPAFVDPVKKCVNFEILWTRATVAVGRKLVAVYIAPPDISIAEAEDGVMVSVTGKIYGGVANITAFTVGTQSPSS
jgi:hypothetical protein